MTAYATASSNLGCLRLLLVVPAGPNIMQVHRLRQAFARTSAGVRQTTERPTWIRPMALKFVCPCRSKKNDSSSSSSPGGKGDSGGVAANPAPPGGGPVVHFPRKSRFPPMLPVAAAAAAFPRALPLQPLPKQKALAKLFRAAPRARMKPPGANRGRPGRFMIMNGRAMSALLLVRRARCVPGAPFLKTQQQYSSSTKGVGGCEARRAL